MRLKTGENVWSLLLVTQLSLIYLTMLTFIYIDICIYTQRKIIYSETTSTKAQNLL